MSDAKIPFADNKLPIVEHIKQIADPRAKSFNFKHSLTSVIFIALVGALCGADDWVSVQSVGEKLQDWIKRFVDMSHGVPSHDTFRRVFNLLSPKAFGDFLIRWMDHLRSKNGREVLSFDGKTLRGSAQRGIGVKALHLVNVWSHDNGICLAQLKVDDKSNEITAVPELLSLLDIKDTIVTADAM